MKNLAFGLPVLIVLGMLTFQPVGAKPIKETSQAAFSKDVLTSEKPVVVDFFATWCGPCKRMEPVLDDLAKLYGGKASFLRVDIDKNHQLAEQFNISAIPAILIFKNGKAVDNSIGLVPKDQLWKKIEAVVAGSSQ